LLKVWFSNVEDNLITNHEKIDFQKGVELTNELEMKCRNEQITMSSEFTVIDDNTNESLYTGVFNFGSYDYPNIYHQIKDKANKIKVDKSKQSDKNYLLEKIEELTSDELKREEKIDKTLINIEKDNISKLKKWQRRTIYSLMMFFLITSIMLTVWSITQMASYEKALNQGRQEVETKKNLIAEYENALQGDEESLIEYLQEQDDLSENQEVLLVNHFINESEYKKAVKILGDNSRTETMILMNDKYDRDTKVSKIKEFNELYSTNEARFDLAYFDSDYELMLNIQDVNMVSKRSRMKTRAYIKLDQLDEAKEELKNNNDEHTKEMVEKYEILTTEIDTLKEKIDKEKDKKAKKKLESELKEKEKERNEL